MATIKIFDGAKSISVEVSEDFAKVYKEMDYAESLIERKETRRHQSLNKSIDNGWQIKDEKNNVELKVENMEMIACLHKAIKSLSADQQSLLKKVYFDGISQIEIARQENVSKKAINNRINRILNKIKIFFK